MATLILPPIVLQQQVDHEVGVGVAPGRQPGADELPVRDAVVLTETLIVAPVDRAHDRRRDPVVLDLSVAAVLAGGGESHRDQAGQRGGCGGVVGGGGAGEEEQQGGEHVRQ